MEGSKAAQQFSEYAERFASFTGPGAAQVTDQAVRAALKGGPSRAWDDVDIETAVSLATQGQPWEDEAGGDCVVDTDPPEFPAEDMLTTVVFAGFTDARHAALARRCKGASLAVAEPDNSRGRLVLPPGVSGAAKCAWLHKQCGMVAQQSSAILYKTCPKDRQACTSRKAC